VPTNQCLNCGIMFYSRHWKVVHCDKPECQEAKEKHIIEVRRKCSDDWHRAHGRGRRVPKPTVDNEGRLRDDQDRRLCQRCFKPISKANLEAGYRIYCKKCHKIVSRGDIEMEDSYAATT